MIVESLTDEERTTWIITYSGGRFHPFQPRSDEVRIIDIAHSLAMQSPRYLGHCPQPYTTAQHSVEVAHRAEENGASPYVCLSCLFHDASNAYLPGLPQSIKTFLPEYQRIENLIQQAIWAYVLGGNPDPETMAYVRSMDLLMNAAELRSFFANAHELTGIRAIKRLKNWRGSVGSAHTAEKEFLTMFDIYQDAWLRHRDKGQ